MDTLLRNSVARWHYVFCWHKSDWLYSCRFLFCQLLSQIGNQQVFRWNLIHKLFCSSDFFLVQIYSPLFFCLQLALKVCALFFKFDLKLLKLIFKLFGVRSILSNQSIKLVYLVFVAVVTTRITLIELSHVFIRVSAWAALRSGRSNHAFICLWCAYNWEVILSSTNHLSFNTQFRAGFRFLNSIG